MKLSNYEIDLVIEETTTTIRAFSRATSKGFFPDFFVSNVNTTQSTSTSGSVTEAIGLAISTPLTSADGADIFQGTAEVSAITDTVAIADALAISEAMDDAVDMRVTVLGDAFATVTGNAIAVGIDSSSTVSSGDGADLILGQAIYRGAIGPEVNATTIGIRGGSYDLGNGNDIVRAIASGGGINIGVQDVLIDGGEGADTFELQSGTGVVIGGGGDDLLLLEGSKTDYTFTALTSSLGVSIQKNGTNLTVSDVESFQFAGDLAMTYQYTDLFTV
ncbi:hypothetical protein [Leptothoe sp. PORK10 BA2]|uniref:hypothetical protein n=1 Tax=Leptothoe sp. PORK10 BA2 TaxID=3110254 RepID=UPI002B200AD6|nr:hypothetical protein [Leptothoe sp. PORK10 BA2]MEA5466582.1 hypothetical protein [Leptothoe sp. PORK10 BA2]